MKISNFLGWLGMVILQGATLPTMIGILNGSNPNMPELSMVLMMQAGLFLYAVRAIAQRDVLYIVSNGIGFALYSVLLTIIVFRG